MVFDFVDDYMDDLERGSVRPLVEYLARYAGHENAVAREYLALVDRARTKTSRPSPDGERRVGPYRLIEELGRGGQGTVFLAEDTRIARRVALKLLSGGFVSEERRARLRREAETIARLAHAGICGVHEADVDGGVPYIAMHYVEGKSLARALETQTGPWCPTQRGDLHQVLRFFERAARALHAAHEADVVHRDVKPGNLLVTPEGEPVVLDFGLAMDERGEGVSITRQGEQFGTPGYMAPEQLRGEGATRSTDVYGLGVTAFEALTRRRPFEAPGRVELERKILEAPVPDPRSFNDTLGEDVKVVLETALERDPARRYATAFELAEDLRRIREYEPIRARPASAPLRLARWVRREPVLATTVIGTLVVLSVALTLSLWFIAREQRALRFALGRHLAERATALLEEDPAAALALGVEAVEYAPNYLTRSALFSALEACNLQTLLRNDPPARFGTLAVSPDGQLLAGGLEDESLRVWSLVDGESVCGVDALGGAVLRLAFGPESQRIAAATRSGEVFVYELARTDAPLWRARVSDGPIVWIEFDPAGELLVVQPAEVPARVLDARDGELELELPTRPFEAGCARFHPNGALVLTTSLGRQGAPSTSSNVANLWDARTGARFAAVSSAAAITWSEFAPDGSHFVTADAGGTVHVWNAREPADRPVATIDVEYEVTCATFAPDGRTLAITTDGGVDSGAWVWDFTKDASLELIGHEGSTIVHAAFAPDGTRLATCSYDMSVRTWSLPDGEPLTTFNAFFQPLRALWSSDGVRVATLSNGPWAHVWRAGKLPDTYRLTRDAATVTWTGFLAEGELALTAASNGTLSLWSTPSTAGPGAPGDLVRSWGRHGGAVRGVAPHADGERFLTWSDDGSARLFTIDGPGERGVPFAGSVPLVDAHLHPSEPYAACVDASGDAWLWRLNGDVQAVELAGHAGKIRVARFSPDGSSLATAGEDDAVCLHDPRSGSVVRRMAFQSSDDWGSGVHDIDFRSDGRELAFGCADQRVRFRDPRSGEPTRDDVVLFEPKAVRYAPDGNRLLVYGHRGGGSVRVQNLDRAGYVRPELFHTGHIEWGEFSPDGAWVVTASRDGTVYVWDSATGQPFAHRTGYGGAVLHAAFSRGPGELRVVAGCADGSVSVWPMDPLPAARARQPRALEEWEVARERRLAEPLRYEPLQRED
ncbi:MAG: protein kinase [bacterium]|nr:protein kinase [bacterium]